MCSGTYPPAISHSFQLVLASRPHFDESLSGHFAQTDPNPTPETPMIYIKSCNSYKIYVYYNITYRLNCCNNRWACTSEGANSTSFWAYVIASFSFP